MLVNLPFEQEIFAIAKGLYGHVIKEAILTHLRGIIVPGTGKHNFTTTKTEGSIELICEYPREAYDPEYWQPGNEWIEAFIDFEFEGLMGLNEHNCEENTTVFLTYKGTQKAEGGKWEEPAIVNINYLDRADRENHITSWVGKIYSPI